MLKYVETEVSSLTRTMMMQHDSSTFRKREKRPRWLLFEHTVLAPQATQNRPGLGGPSYTGCTTGCVAGEHRCS
jgi:hypothetical protein